jgi:hypothetical protein
VRVHDWPERLAEVIEAARARDFVADYGEHKCALFAADCVRAITGIDYAEPYRDRARTVAQVLAGHGSLVGLVTAILGEPIEPSFAGRGDVVVANVPTLEGGDSVGVCLGAFCAFPKDVGLVFYSRTVAKLAWRI